MGKLLIVLGAVVLALGLLLLLGSRYPSARLGRLPGDIYLRRGNWHIYIPLTTGLLLSLLLSLIAWLVRRR